MDFHWLGPYKILQALGRGLYRIEGVHDADVIPRIHGVHLKKYIILLVLKRLLKSLYTVVAIRQDFCLFFSVS